MCGICGRLNFKNRQPVDAQTITRMTRSMVHRGPDDQGIHISGELGLGFRRLSIIDIAGGHQPMSDDQSSVWVVFNGDIYNFPELKEELVGYGHRFRTRSDTEVIVHGYKQWGKGLFKRLNGMFGLAIWDERRRRLILARDPMGIKMIYYRLTADRIDFGSEIRPILAADYTHTALDPSALNLFLRYRYTPSPLTLYKGIRKLAAGTLIEIEDGRWRMARWYDFRPQPFADRISVHEATEALLYIYTRAVKRQLISDVPLGLLLSGGIDSGLLLGLMSLSGQNWQTYTVGYGRDFSDDELSDAKESAAIFGARNISVHLDRREFETALPQIIGSLEEPVASSSVVPMYFVCKRAREDLKVALVGQGPDELFGGYWRHLGVRYGDYLRKLPSTFVHTAVRLIDALPRNETLKRGIHALTVPGRIQRYQQVFSILPADTIDGLFREGALPAHSGDMILECWHDLVPLMAATDELGGLQFLEIRSSLPDELLMYADKMSMAHGLEVRVPYLDREVVEFAECLGADFKVRNGVRKWLHRQVCRNFLPAAILRRKKRGFAVNVVDGWFQDSMTGKMNDVLLDRNSRMYTYLKHAVVARLYRQHTTGRQDHHKILFSLIVFEEWLRSTGIADISN
jgi:asparagine synthase (glutamine-hydrolysing)